ncbi:MAG: type II toxin-antitoxin system VapC family toxin [Paludibacteraceae bacterium]|nr:type II toxin-antitoxin system VapC family toxin [Paludibacteraceae bacterium]MBR0064686.1 type II toxin-antitoxin system VapC family toxin [Paludibacteraceae bacterium]
MRYLIDTNIFIFQATDPQQLNRDVAEILGDYENLIYISTESLRELIIHYNNKALLRKYWKTKTDMLRSITTQYGLQILPLAPDVMYTYGKMNLYHNDPSDHVIIAQAIAMKMPLISDDNRFPDYRKEGLELIEN